tara:strand:+ start:3041 stop:3223 length:183 start_codon:yes stop_codon:yes gene_type:complete
MKIKLNKDWRAFGQTNKAGTILDITNKETIAYLKDNGFLYEEKKEKKEKKSNTKIAKENN